MINTCSEFYTRLVHGSSSYYKWTFKLLHPRARKVVRVALSNQIAALERSRKIEEVQKRLVESEMLRTRCNRKLTLLKEQMRSTTETAEQERSISDHSLQLLRDELAQVKQNLSELTKRESQVSVYRGK